MLSVSVQVMLPFSNHSLHLTNVQSDNYGLSLSAHHREDKKGCIFNCIKRQVNNK